MFITRVVVNPFAPEECNLMPQEPYPFFFRTRNLLEMLILYIWTLRDRRFPTALTGKLLCTIETGR